MSKVKALIDGFVGVDGVPHLLAVGDEYEADHPLVTGTSGLFSEPVAEPKRPVLGRKTGKDADG